jgi:hypothetical protein
MTKRQLLGGGVVVVVLALVGIGIAMVSGGLGSARERGKPWELRGQQLIAQYVRLRGRVGESGIPAVEVVGELVVEDSGADLK